MPKFKFAALALGLLFLSLIFYSCGKRSVVTDLIPPDAQITFPLDGAVLNGDTIFVTVIASDNQGVNRVEFYVDGSLNFTDQTAPFIFPWLILVYNDSTIHTLSAIALDGAGNADTFSISVTVRVTPGFYFISSAATAGVVYYNLFVWGNYVALAQQGNGVQIFDISNPASPKFLSSYSTGGGSANGVFVSGNYLFVAYGQDGLHVVDVTNPAFPVFRSSLIAPGFADVENVFVSGSYAYLAAKNSGMYIVDLSNLDTLSVISQYNLGSGIAYDIKVMDTLAFIAYGDVGLEIVNVKNPLIPAFVGRYTPAGSAVVRRLDVVGDRAYLAMQNSGLDLVSLVVMTNPVQLGNFNTFNSFFTGVQVEGDSLAFVANRDDGVQIVDVSIPATPSSVTFFNTEGQANNLIFRNSFIFVADQSSLTVLRYVP